MDAKQLAAAGLIPVAAALTGAVLASQPGNEPGVGGAEPTAGSETVRVRVHVSGHVVSPGLVTLDDGALVADAIAASGGAAPGARLEGLNLARVVAAGEQIHVPGPDGLDPEAAGGDGGAIPLNRADATQLEQLPGVGPVLAERIVAFRDENGPFQRVEDLLLVPGIGEAKLASIRDLVTVP